MKRPFWEGPPRVEFDQVSDWTIPAIVRERSRREPENAVFATWNGDRYEAVSWRAFATMVAEVSVGLWRLGVVPGDRVAVMGDAALEWVVSDFGCLGAGGICVGIYQTSAVPEVAYILADSAPKVFFGQRKEHLDCGLDAFSTLDAPAVKAFVLMEGDINDLKAAPAGARIMTLAELRAEGAEALLSDPALFDRLVDLGESSDLARIIYTSGTTGRPKGVSYTHAAWVLVGEQWVLRYSPLRERPHRIASFLSTAHVASAMVTEIVPLVSKLVPHFASPKAELLDVFRIVRPDIQGMTPRFFQKIAVQLAVQQESGSTLSKYVHRSAMRFGRSVVHDRWDGKAVPAWKSALLNLLRATLFRRLLATVGLDHLRRAQTGSAMMPVDVATLWAVWGIDIREAYGLSEAACAVAFQQEPFPKPGSIGKLMVPQPGTELKLAEDGEILFKSPMVFSGYWNAPEATAKVLRDGWFFTGDIAERLPDDNLRLIGRKNDAISTAGGKTINPAEIENELKLSPYISEAIVFGHAEKYLVALIEFEFASTAAWAREKGLAAQSYAELADQKEVVKLLDEHVAIANENLGRVMQIKKFRVIPVALDSVKDALTAAKKVKRRVVREQFHDLIESMYDRSEDRILSAGLRR